MINLCILITKIWRLLSKGMLQMVSMSFKKLVPLILPFFESLTYTLYEGKNFWLKLSWQTWRWCPLACVNVSHMQTMIACAWHFAASSKFTLSSSFKVKLPPYPTCHPLNMTCVASTVQHSQASMRKTASAVPDKDHILTSLGNHLHKLTKLLSLGGSMHYIWTLRFQNSWVSTTTTSHAMYSSKTYLTLSGIRTYARITL